jgi:hypothetical protein
MLHNWFAHIMNRILDDQYQKNPTQNPLEEEVKIRGAIHAFRFPQSRKTSPARHKLLSGRLECWRLPEVYLVKMLLRTSNE